MGLDDTLRRKKAAAAARPKRPSKRLVSCGTCRACTRSECGECINCLDKLKFGGQGIRKQCCINRRCLKLKQNAAPPPQPSWSANAAPPQQPSWSASAQDETPAQEVEQRLFWAAVAGCMKLNNGEAHGVVGVESARDSPRRGCSPTPTCTSTDEETVLERPQKSGSNISDESGLCFKLVSLLASNGTLASKPIAVRLMSSSDQPALAAMLKTAQEQDVLRTLAHALSPAVA